jgi:fluoroquinolone transport system ATP-binding protein
MINVSNLTYRYPKAESDTLKGLNFKISKGEIFDFLGPSGAGKSTCQKILYVFKVEPLNSILYGVNKK